MSIVGSERLQLVILCVIKILIDFLPATNIDDNFDCFQLAGMAINMDSPSRKLAVCLQGRNCHFGFSVIEDLCYIYFFYIFLHPFPVADLCRTKASTNSI